MGSREEEKKASRDLSLAAVSQDKVAKMSCGGEKKKARSER